MNDLIVFNKPYGVICQFSAHEKHASLKDYIDAPGFYPAGRLDTDSEGLLLLTNNGRLQAQIAEPKFGKEKTYWAQLEGSPDEAKLNLLRQKMDLGDFIARPARVRVLDAAETAALWPRQPPIRVRKSVPDFWLEITLGEGKNRQVRRMTAKAGYPCLRLVRVAIGRLNLFEQTAGFGAMAIQQREALKLFY
jgi:23S rRNA pseudouridine2457 synthase